MRIRRRLLLTVPLIATWCLSNSGCGSRDVPMTEERMRQIVRDELRANYLQPGEEVEEVEWSGLYCLRGTHERKWVEESAQGRRVIVAAPGEAYAMILWFRPRNEQQASSGRLGELMMGNLAPAPNSGLRLPAIFVVCRSDGSRGIGLPALPTLIEDFELVAAPPTAVPPASGGQSPPPPPPPPAIPMASYEEARRAHEEAVAELAQGEAALRMVEQQYQQAETLRMQFPQQDADAAPAAGKDVFTELRKGIELARGLIEAQRKKVAQARDVMEEARLREGVPPGTHP